MAKKTYPLKDAAELLHLPAHVVRKYITEFGSWLQDPPHLKDDQITIANHKILTGIIEILNGSGYDEIRKILEEKRAARQMYDRISPYFSKGHQKLKDRTMDRFGISGSPLGVLRKAYALLVFYHKKEIESGQLDRLKTLSAEIHMLEDELNLLKDPGALAGTIGNQQLRVTFNFEHEGFNFPYEILQYPEFPTHENPLPEADLSFSVWTQESTRKGIYAVQIRHEGLPKSFAGRDLSLRGSNLNESFSEIFYIKTYPTLFRVKDRYDKVWDVLVEHFDTGKKSVLIKIMSGMDKKISC